MFATLSIRAYTIHATSVREDLGTGTARLILLQPVALPGSLSTFIRSVSRPIINHPLEITTPPSRSFCDYRVPQGAGRSRLNVGKYNGRGVLGSVLRLNGTSKFGMYGFALGSSHLMKACHGTQTLR